MTYSEYPAEIRALVKQRVEEAGNVYRPEVFDKNNAAGKSSGGFTWESTPEGQDFWREVLCRNDAFDLFFEKYPKSNEDDIWLGDTVEVVKVGKWKDRIYVGLTFTIEEVREVDDCKKFNTGKSTALFNNDEFSVNWERNMLKKVDSKKKEPASNQYYFKIPRDVEEGDKFIVVHDKRLSGEIASYPHPIGSVYTLEQNDGTHWPFFIDGQGRRCAIDWGLLAPYNETETKIDNNNEKVNTTSNCTELELRTIQSSVTVGSPLRGIELRGSSKEIRMGG